VILIRAVIAIIMKDPVTTEGASGIRLIGSMTHMLAHVLKRI